MSPSSTASVRDDLLHGFSYSNGAAADYGVYEICPIQWEISVISTSMWISLPEFLKECHLPILRHRIAIRRRNKAGSTLENSISEHVVFPFMNPRFKSINSCEEMISQNYYRSSQCGDRSGMTHLEGRSPEVEAL